MSVVLAKQGSAGTTGLVLLPTTAAGEWQPVGEKEPLIRGAEYRTTYYLRGAARAVGNLAFEIPGGVATVTKLLAPAFAKGNAHLDRLEVFDAAPVKMPLPRTGQLVDTTPVTAYFTATAGVEPTIGTGGALLIGAVGLSDPLIGVAVVVALLGAAALAGAIAVSIVGTTVERHGKALAAAVKDAVVPALGAAADAAKDTLFNPGLLVLVAVVLIVFARHHGGA